MANKKKKLSPTQKEYNKQLARIRRFIKSAEKRGYRFDDKALPKRPKRVTKASVRALKNITPDVLYRHASALSPTGEIISGTEARKIERSESAKRAAKTRAEKHRGKASPAPGDLGYRPRIADVVLRNVEELITQFDPSNIQPEWLRGLHERHYTLVQRVFYGQINIYGRAAVAYRLERSAYDIIQIVNRMLYGDSKGEAFDLDLATFAAAIKGEGLSPEEREIAESYEFMQ